MLYSFFLERQWQHLMLLVFMALYLSENGNLTAEELKSIILKNGNTGILKSIPLNTPNNLLSILSLLQNQKSNKPVAQ